MENKEKPSELVLMPEHNFVNRSIEENSNGVLFTPAMLKWPIMTYQIEHRPVEEAGAVMYRNMLQALTDIHPFNTYISMKADLQKEKLFLTKRTWGKIYLENESVIQLSHHTKRNNDPYDTVFDWPEMLQSTSYASEESQKAMREIISTVTGWSVKDWKGFFELRIRERIVFLSTKADNLVVEAKSYTDSAEKISLALAWYM